MANWARERAGYRRDGVVVVRALVDGPSVERARRHLATMAAALPASCLLSRPIEDDEFFSGLVGWPALEGLAAALLGETPVAFGCTYIVKPANSDLPVSWHQDGHPWRTTLGIANAVTLWVALDETGPGNGGLRVIPGSHARPCRPLRPVDGKPDLFGYEMDPPPVDPEHAVDLSMRPGDVSAHHPFLIHSSPPNRSASPRRALAIRYRGALAREGPPTVTDRVDMPL